MKLTKDTYIEGKIVKEGAEIIIEESAPAQVKESNRALEAIVLSYIKEDGRNAGEYLAEDILEIGMRYVDDPKSFKTSFVKGAM